MRYLGSKAKLFKYIGPLIQSYIDGSGAEVYVEPFVGGCNSIDKIKCMFRMGVDANRHLIAMWKALQKGWEPPEVCTRNEYNQCKELLKIADIPPSPYYGFVGIACAFSGSWFAGYSEADGRNRCAESKRAVLKQIKNLQDVAFFYGDYKIAEHLAGKKAVIYCDPPYKGIKLYPGADIKFNHEEFWQWCLEVAKKGHIVLVSEYQAPKNSRIKLIWEQETKVYAHQTSSKVRTEKLYLVEGDK